MARPRKTIEQIKIFQINFRITLNEQIQLESFAKNYGLNVVEYVRRRALQKQLPKFVMSGLERDLLIELSRIGNNINQMSKRVNQGNPNLKGIEDEFECKLVDFYIDDIDYREVKTDNNCIILYKNNLKIIDFLKEIANNIKKSGNNLELFFYRTGVGVDLKIDYDIESLKKIDFVIPDDFKTQILDSFNGKDKKELFINELINFIESNNCSYVNLIENWNTLLSNYTKSYSLFIAGFSFEKIKTSSNEHFQKLVDRIYESIGKVSSYIFGIPIGYILLINNFDFSGEQCFKNTSFINFPRHVYCSTKSFTFFDFSVKCNFLSFFG